MLFNVEREFLFAGQKKKVGDNLVISSKAVYTPLLSSGKISEVIEVPVFAEEPVIEEPKKKKRNKKSKQTEES